MEMELMSILPNTAFCKTCICREIADLAVAIRVVSNPANGVEEKRHLSEHVARYMKLLDEETGHAKGQS